MFRQKRVSDWKTYSGDSIALARRRRYFNKVLSLRLPLDAYSACSSLPTNEPQPKAPPLCGLHRVGAALIRATAQWTGCDLYRIGH
jgi:hypothetical protein